MAAGGGAATGAAMAGGASSLSSSSASSAAAASKADDDTRTPCLTLSRAAVFTAAPPDFCSRAPDPFCLPAAAGDGEGEEEAGRERGFEGARALGGACAVPDAGGGDGEEDGRKLAMASLAKSSKP